MHTIDVCVYILQEDKQKNLANIYLEMLKKKKKKKFNFLSVILEKICCLLFLSLLLHSGANVDVHFFVEKIWCVKKFSRTF